MARVPFAMQAFDGLSYLHVQWLDGVGRVFDGEREDSAGGVEHLAVAEEGCDGGRVECGGHDDDLEVGARGLLQATEECEREVAVDVALVELIEYDGVDAGEERVADEAAYKDAFGDEAKARLRADGFFEAHLEADGFAGLLVPLPCDAACGHACGESTRFKDDDFAGNDLEECGWDAGGLAGAGFCLQDEVVAGA